MNSNSSFFISTMCKKSVLFRNCWQFYTRRLQFPTGIMWEQNAHRIRTKKKLLIFYVFRISVKWLEPVWVPYCESNYSRSWCVRQNVRVRNTHLDIFFTVKLTQWKYFDSVNSPTNFRSYFEIYRKQAKRARCPISYT